jgi:hypothetical protein
MLRPSVAVAGQSEGRGSGGQSTFGIALVIADLDGDQRPDLATVSVAQTNLQSTDYFIRLRFSASPDSTIGLTARGGGLDLSSRDVNGDSFLDLVVSTTLDSRIVAVLVNDGHGNFSVADPSTFPTLTTSLNDFLQGPPDLKQELTALVSPRSNFGDHAEASRAFARPKLGEAILQRIEVSASTGSFFCRLGRSPPRSFHTT